MKEVKRGTKLQKQLVNSYANACYHAGDCDDIYKVYSNPSKGKVKAWQDCKEKCRNYGGKGLLITSHNGYVFSAAFLYENQQEHLVMLYTITKSCDYTCQFIYDL